MQGEVSSHRRQAAPVTVGTREYLELSNIQPSELIAVETSTITVQRFHLEHLLKFLRRRRRSVRRIRLIDIDALHATCELVRSSFAASRCTGIVLTRGALQPLREALTLLGEDDPEFSMADSRRPHVSRERHE
jgi:hypothetical protein